MKDEVAVLYDQITDAFVEVSDLWDFGSLQNFCEVIYLCADRVVVVCKFM